MIFSFFVQGFEWEDFYIKLLRKVGKARGHEAGELADVVFMMAYSDSHSHQVVDRASVLAKGGSGKRVVVLSPKPVTPDTMRKFFQTGKVYDVLDAPFDESVAHEIFMELEEEFD